MASVLQPTSSSALNRDDVVDSMAMAAQKRPVSPGPSLLKRPPPQNGGGEAGGPLGGKPQRNMLATPAQRLRQGPQMVVIQREKPPTFATRVKDGIFCKSFGGGQVDIVSGKFVFSCTEAYRVKNGKLGDPIKGATLIGDGPTVLTKLTGIGNDSALDEGVGICGKGGQTVPAGVGQPTLLVSGLTVGGTAAA